MAALLDRLRAAGATEQATELATRAAAGVSLDDPAGVARLLDSLREAGATEQATELATRAAAGVSLDDPWRRGLAAGQPAGGGRGPSRPPSWPPGPPPRVSLDNPDGVARLLDSLRAAGAAEQATELATRAAAGVSLDDPVGVAALLDSLRAAGATEQVAELADPGRRQRLPR